MSKNKYQSAQKHQFTSFPDSHQDSMEEVIYKLLYHLKKLGLLRHFVSDKIAEIVLGKIGV